MILTGYAWCIIMLNSIAIIFYVHDIKCFLLLVSRCTQEMHEALQMAMAGHARILDQYAELQEKHILVLANMREIRHGVIEYKREARECGFDAVEDQWFDSQATQITYLKVEQERLKEQIKGLQAQLDDSADAVQAAGELLVRLKESEQAAVLAKVGGCHIPRLAFVTMRTSPLLTPGSLIQFPVCLSFPSDPQF